MVELNPTPAVTWLFIPESSIVWIGSELDMWLSMTLNSWSSCLYHSCTPPFLKPMLLAKIFTEKPCLKTLEKQ